VSFELAEVDGIRLRYEDVGEGDPALLFLTGWCSSLERWDEVASRCSKRRRVIRFDWRGHGGSDATGDFGVSEMVDDALAVIDASGVEEVVPCAASHAGWVAIELRRRLGVRVPMLVHADWMLVEPSERYMGVIRQLQGAEWPEGRDTLFRIWAAGVDTPAISSVLGVMAKQGEEMWQRYGREIEGSYTRGGSPLHAFETLDPPVPVLHLYGQPHDESYLGAQQTYAVEHDWFQVRKLDAVTHFSMVESPEEVADEIERFVAVNSVSAAGGTR
jgi:pimeloyl-ACP methyl ester carboxylesterase